MGDEVKRSGFSIRDSFKKIRDMSVMGRVNSFGDELRSRMDMTFEGYRPCDECGRMRPPEESRCPVCGSPCPYTPEQLERMRRGSGEHRRNKALEADPGAVEPIDMWDGSSCCPLCGASMGDDDRVRPKRGKRMLRYRS